MQRTSTEAAVVPVSRHRSRLEQKLDVLRLLTGMTFSRTRMCGLANLDYMRFLSIEKELTEARAIQKAPPPMPPIRGGSFNLLKQHKEHVYSRYILTITEKGMLALYLHRRVQELLGEQIEATTTA